LGQISWLMLRGVVSVVKRKRIPRFMSLYSSHTFPYGLLTFHSLQELSSLGAHSASPAPSNPTITPSTFTDKIAYAFQLATAQGPLCAEPVQGIAVFLEDVTISIPAEEENPASHDRLGRLTGEAIKTVRDSVRQGFLDWSPRMLLAMYSCEIQASSKFCYTVSPI